jgi:hypothetical protein
MPPEALKKLWLSLWVHCWLHCFAVPHRWELGQARSQGVFPRNTLQRHVGVRRVQKRQGNNGSRKRKVARNIPQQPIITKVILRVRNYKTGHVHSWPFTTTSLSLLSIRLLLPTPHSPFQYIFLIFRSLTLFLEWEVQIVGAIENIWVVGDYLYWEAL